MSMDGEVICESHWFKNTRIMHAMNMPRKLFSDFNRWCSHAWLSILWVLWPVVLSVPNQIKSPLSRNFRSYVFPWGAISWRVNGWYLCSCFFLEKEYVCNRKQNWNYDTSHFHQSLIFSMLVNCKRGWGTGYFVSVSPSNSIIHKGNTEDKPTALSLQTNPLNVGSDPCEKYILRSGLLWTVLGGMNCLNVLCKSKPNFEVYYFSVRGKITVRHMWYSLGLCKCQILLLSFQLRVVVSLISQNSCMFS